MCVEKDRDYILKARAEAIAAAEKSPGHRVKRVLILPESHSPSKAYVIEAYAPPAHNDIPLAPRRPTRAA